MDINKLIAGIVIVFTLMRVIPAVLSHYETIETKHYNLYTEELTKLGGVNWKVLYDLPVTGEMLINIPYMVSEFNKAPTIQGTSYAKLNPIRQQHIIANALDSYRLIDVNKDAKTLATYKRYRAIVLLENMNNRGYLNNTIPPNYKVPNVTLRNNLRQDVVDERGYLKLKRIYNITLPTIGNWFRVKIIGFGPSADYTPYVLEDTYVKYTGTRRLILGTRGEPILKVTLNRFNNTIIKITSL